MRNKQAAPLSKFIVMTGFCDLNFSVKRNTASQTYRYIEIFAHPKNFESSG